MPSGLRFVCLSEASGFGVAIGSDTRVGWDER